MDNKKAVILNYGTMVRDIYYDLKEHSEFIHRFFRNEPSLNSDRDLTQIAYKFQEFCEKLKELDNLINKIGEKNVTN